MAALLISLLFALQDRPEIREIQPIAGEFARSGCWRPLKVRLAGPAGFECELVGSADSGLRVSRAIKIPASGAIDVILPVVLLATDAKVEVVLRGPDGELARKTLGTPVQLLRDERLVLIDPKHPECESWTRNHAEMPNGTKVRFVASDPADWNEAAEMGALEAVDAVVSSEASAVDLSMTVWRALGGALVTQPLRDLFQKLQEPATRFPIIDPLVGRFAVNEPWIARKRDSTLLFIVIYGFSFFVAVYVTWSRRGGPWLVAVAALGMAAVFVAAFSSFYPKDSLALRSWQGVVDAPEAPVAISISALWGSGRAGDVRFGRIVKPVYPTALEASRRPLELRLDGEGRWIVRGAAPGDPARFVSVERMPAIEPFVSGGMYTLEESAYYVRIPRKRSIRLQDPATAPGVPVSAKGVIESERARVFRVDLIK